MSFVVIFGRLAFVPVMEMLADRASATGQLSKTMTTNEGWRGCKSEKLWTERQREREGEREREREREREKERERERESARKRCDNVSKRQSERCRPDRACMRGRRGREKVKMIDSREEQKHQSETASAVHEKGREL